MNLETIIYVAVSLLIVFFLILKETKEKGVKYIERTVGKINWGDHLSIEPYKSKTHYSQTSSSSTTSTTPITLPQKDADIIILGFSIDQKIASADIRFILIPIIQRGVKQGLITLYLEQKSDGNKKVMARLLADIKVPFAKDTKIVLFVDDPNGEAKPSKEPFLFVDKIWIGVSEDDRHWRVVYGPVRVGELWQPPVHSIPVGPRTITPLQTFSPTP